MGLFTALLTLPHPPMCTVWHFCRKLNVSGSTWSTAVPLSSCFKQATVTQMCCHRKIPLICWCWHTSSSFCFRRNKHPLGLICDVILEVLFNFVCKQVFQQHRGIIACQCPLCFLTKVLRSSLSISKLLGVFQMSLLICLYAYNKKEVELNMCLLIHINRKISCANSQFKSSGTKKVQ